MLRSVWRALTLPLRRYGDFLRAHRAQTAAWLSEGLCSECGEPRKADMTFCDNCRGNQMAAP